MLVRALLILVLAVSTVVPAGAAEQSLANTIKKIFSTPTPTPKPRKKKKSSSTTKKPSPSPAASPKKKPSPANEESPAPSVTPSSKMKKPYATPSGCGIDLADCVSFVLQYNVDEAEPRVSSEQYVWLRRSRSFEAVLSQKDNSFELADLKSSDLLFCTGTYSIERAPPITHAMI